RSSELIHCVEQAGRAPVQFRGSTNPTADSCVHCIHWVVRRLPSGRPMRWTVLPNSSTIRTRPLLSGSKLHTKEQRYGNTGCSPRGGPARCDRQDRWVYAAGATRCGAKSHPVAAVRHVIEDSVP